MILWWSKTSIQSKEKEVWSLGEKKIKTESFKAVFPNALVQIKARPAYFVCLLIISSSGAYFQSNCSNFELLVLAVVFHIYLLSARLVYFYSFLRSSLCPEFSVLGFTQPPETVNPGKTSLCLCVLKCIYIFFYVSREQL